MGRREERIRLIGIDAPELDQSPWGRAALRRLSELAGSEVRVSTDVRERDRYGRLLAYVWNSEGEMLNLRMLKDGYCVLYTIPPNVAHAGLFRKAQAEARKSKKGFWKEGGLSERPSEYRKKHRRD
jgi:micrococcal nuclease